MDMVEEFLYDRQGLDLMDIFDEKGFSTLHWATYKNSFECTRMLLEHQISSTTHELQISPDNRKRLIRTFINTPSQDDEGFYPLHFASYHGNPELIDYLVSYGANV